MDPPRLTDNFLNLYMQQLSRRGPPINLRLKNTSVMNTQKYNALVYSVTAILRHRHWECYGWSYIPVADRECTKRKNR